MNKTYPADIQKLKDKLEGFGLEFSGELCDSPLTWLGEYILEGSKPQGNLGKEIIQWLNTELKFKFVEAIKKDDMETGFTVISLNDKLYKLDYYFGSSEYISCDDPYNWKPVEAKTKTVNVYE